jgi:hypothetical protein
MHPTLLSGSKLTIILSNPKLNIIAFDGGTTNPMAVPADTTITLSNIGLNLQQVELYDGISRMNVMLKEISELITKD